MDEVGFSVLFLELSSLALTFFFVFAESSSLGLPPAIAGFAVKPAASNNIKNTRMRYLLKVMDSPASGCDYLFTYLRAIFLRDSMTSSANGNLSRSGNGRRRNGPFAPFPAESQPRGRKIQGRSLE